MKSCNSLLWFGLLLRQYCLNGFKPNSSVLVPGYQEVIQANYELSGILAATRWLYHQLSSPTEGRGMVYAVGFIGPMHFFG